MEVAELFNLLESNQPQIAEDIKKTFHEHFNATKESWLVNGLFDYYLSTGSVRTVEILVGVREPHDKYLFDRLCESFRGTSKLQALTLLGHVVRRQPTWLYKVTQHPLLRDLLKLLKVETDILPLMSALLVVIVLLPMIAGLMEPYLQDIFQVFSRLAEWNTNNPNKVPEVHLLHLQMGLYALFHRLYGMYPCNFLSYLRHQYSLRDKLAIFSHTIKPMLDTVKMHPLLVTATKDAETAATRWKKMEPHDVIVECAKFTVDPVEKTRDEIFSSSIRSRSSFEYSFVVESSYASRNSTGGVNTFCNQLNSSEKEVWSPSVHFGTATPPESAPTSIPHTPIAQTYVVSTSFPQQEGTSPPEAAVEATPETTPIKDIRNVVRGPPPSSNIARALNTFGSSGTGSSSGGLGNGKWGTTSGSSTPTHSQPSSPMKKEASPFRFPPSATEPPAFQQLSTEQRRDSLFSQKMQRIYLERAQASDGTVTVETKSTSSFKLKTNFQPTSPMRVNSGTGWVGDSSIPNSPLPSDSQGEMGSQEDKEVEITMQDENHSTQTLLCRPCDSVLQELPARGDHDHDEDYEECQQDTGSPCTTGGLHMPNSKSMLDFARQVKSRLRFYSQCHQDSYIGLSTGSSPNEGSEFPVDAKVRRTNSCPEMKKTSSVSILSVERPLEEKEEEEMSEHPTLNGHALEIQEISSRKRTLSVSTQTDNPLPYEHLFLGVFPALDHYPQHSNFDDTQSISYHPDSNSSPLLFNHKSTHFSPYQAVDTYIDKVVYSHNEAKKNKIQGIESELNACKIQIQLLNLQLQFEKYRREVHAERNRRLLGKSRNNRALEEHNSALRDQLSLLQKEIEILKTELEKNKTQAASQTQQLTETISNYKKENSELQKECKDVKDRCMAFELELKQERDKTAAVTKEMNETKAVLFDTCNELQQAQSMANAGRELRDELQMLQREITLGGEVQQRYREKITYLLHTSQRSTEANLAHDSYTHQISSLSQTLEARTAALEAAKATITELESLLVKKDAMIADAKRLLKVTKDEYHEQLEAVESKYGTLRAINSKLEEHMLELHHRTETVPPRISTHSPPLSASLSSSGTLSGADAAPIKNLQLLVDTPDPPNEQEHHSPTVE